MSAPVLRIVSYLPNPRVWKALIAAEYCDVVIETRGAKPAELAGWLWDFDARELSEAELIPQNPNARVGRRGFSSTLYKTDDFLTAHPFGTVPAAFDPSGQIGIFESNSILRAVVRCSTNQNDLYGQDAYQASRIDSFLDAGLVFARESQEYLLALPDPSLALYERMQSAYAFYLSGIDAALGNHAYIASNQLSIADISFACDLAQFFSERHPRNQQKNAGQPPISAQANSDYPRAYQHLLNLAQRPEFAKHLTPLTKSLR